ncbi:hypothetical protein [Nonomuraea sp. NPDC005650]|uniref:hypothetical protein n=1 Tax=Nonomuraea sp. NPDC005650 TaxID=3157045 RepID=UPI0033A2D43C
MSTRQLRSPAYSAPGYQQARADARRGENTTAAELVVPGRADLVAERGGHG